MRATALRPRDALHPYQVAAIAFLTADAARQLIAVMGSGKTAVALHAIVDLLQAGQLDNGIVLVVAPLLIAETVWHAESVLWQATHHLKIERVVGSERQRHKALDHPADIYVTNYDNLGSVVGELARRKWRLAVLIADESSRLKNPQAARTQTMLHLSQYATRRWTLTGTPRGQQLTDVWAPATFVTQGAAFPPFYAWRAANFFATDLYQRQMVPEIRGRGANPRPVAAFHLCCRRNRPPDQAGGQRNHPRRAARPEERGGLSGLE
jgi:SNF2-related domain